MEIVGGKLQLLLLSMLRLSFTLPSQRINTWSERPSGLPLEATYS